MPLHVPPAEKDVASRHDRSRVFFPQISIRPLCSVLLLAIAFLAEAHAGLILWGSRGYAENADSKGREWDAAYSMTLGIFNHGFVPSFDNREQWAAEWIGLGTALYDEEEHRFAGAIDTNAHATIPVGAKIYFWAKNGDDLNQGPEWVLLSQNSWTWPAKSNAITPAVTWTTGQSSLLLVVGETEKNGKHLISRALRPLPVSQAAWLADYFSESPASAAANLDPDGDGLPNALEYFLGSNPAKGSSVKSPVMRRDGSGVTLSLARNPQAESGYTLEASKDLKTWFEVGHRLLTDRPDLLETSVPRDASKPTLFFRFQLKPEAK